MKATLFIYLLAINLALCAETDVEADSQEDTFPTISEITDQNFKGNS